MNTTSGPALLDMKADELRPLVAATSATVCALTARFDAVAAKLNYYITGAELGDALGVWRELAHEIEAPLLLLGMASSYPILGEGERREAQVVIEAANTSISRLADVGQAFVARLTEHHDQGGHHGA